MIAASRLRGCTGDAVLTLLRDLGYPVEPLPIPCDEWRRAGIDIGWNDSLQLAVRMPRLDCYLTHARPADDDVTRFLRSLAAYNVLTKPVLIASTPQELTIFDLSSKRTLRRLGVDLASPSRHAVDRLNLLACGGDVERVFDRALDRESVTRQFFERFRNGVHDVAAALRATTREREDAAGSQALLILSRLLFLYFIQRKGWLSGEARFLADRLDAAVRRRSEFFAGVLLPLFFGCLNTSRARRNRAARALGNVPYLNGGLFEPSPFEKRHPRLHLPNELMQRVIDDVFEKFDFSVDEGDAAGTHVDPEMLGKVFESLMAEEERAASGSFYTPKPLVDVLTRRAIVEWCTGGDPLPASRDDARRMLTRLESITILDPACGSGAFLLSALGVLEQLTIELSAAAHKRVPPNLRQTIVERALHGVDLKAEAVRLCELRLWLAIVSAVEVSIEDVRPLPNLDRNILQGNSLLSPLDFLGDGRADVYHEWVYALRTQRDLLARYHNAPHEERPALARMIRANDKRLAGELLEKSIELDERELERLLEPQHDLFGRAKPSDVTRGRELRERIDATRRAAMKIDEGELGFFSFDVHFAHVLAGGGFDVILGNPPWIRNSRIDARSRRMYADRYRLFRGGDAAFHQPDISVAFVEKSLSLVAPDGIVSMLVPAKLLNAAYAAPLREHAARNLSVVALDDWSDDARSLFDADTFPLGLTLARARGNRAVRVEAAGEMFAIPQRDLAFGSEWALLPPAAGAVLRRLHDEHAPLADVLGRMPVMGVKSGDNERFFLEAKRIRGASIETTDGLHVPLVAVCRCVRGRDLRRWSASASQWMLWPPRGGWKRPPRWLERFAAARGLELTDLRLSYVRPEHLGIKVAWKDLSRGLCAAVLPDAVHIAGRPLPLIPNQTLYVLEAASLDEAHALAALLNSTIVNALALCIAERAKDLHYRYFARTVARVPLPAIAPRSVPWARLVRCSRRAHQGADVAEEVDRIAAALYGVSDDELATLRELVARRLGTR